MLTQADRDAVRERARLRAAAARAGTELRTLTVAAAELADGDWIDSVEPELDAFGGVRRPGVTFGRDGARLVGTTPHRERHYIGAFAGETVETGDVVIEVDGDDPVRVASYRFVNVRRRISNDR